MLSDENEEGARWRCFAEGEREWLPFMEGRGKRFEAPLESSRQQYFNDAYQHCPTCHHPLEIPTDHGETQRNL